MITPYLKPFAALSSYDSFADVFYLTTPDNRPAAGSEIDGVIYRQALDNDELVGITIVGLTGWKDQQEELLETILSHFPNIEKHQFIQIKNAFQSILSGSRNDQ